MSDSANVIDDATGRTKSARELAPAVGTDPGPLSPTVSRPWVVSWFALIAVAYALLWSPDWYPLSDSSLYLSLGRSLSSGKGLTMMGDPVRLTPPLAPLLIAGIMKLGGGIGAIQAVMSGLMVVAHVFCFLALRRIVGERLALAATVAAAFSYWVYANAFTIMSEPPCMVAMWAGAWVITLVRPDEAAGRRWGKIATACALLLVAMATRDAVLALVPAFLLLLPGATRPGLRLGAVVMALGVAAGGALLVKAGVAGKQGAVTAYVVGPLVALSGVALAYVLTARRAWLARLFDRLRLPASRPEARVYLTVFVTVFAAWVVLYRYPPKFLRPTAVARTTMPTTLPAWASTMPTSDQLALAPISTGEGDEDVPREGRYKAMWLYGVKRDAKHMLTEPPMLAGRWVSEGLVMASVAVFDAKHKGVAAVGYGAAFVAWLLSCVGLVAMVRRGHWWLLGPALYFMAIWLQWGTRIKPRYMIPVAPVLFVLVWAGLTAVLSRGRLRRFADAATTRLGWGVAVALAGLVVLGNAFPWWVEYRVRHGAHGVVSAPVASPFVPATAPTTRQAATRQAATTMPTATTTAVATVTRPKAATAPAAPAPPRDFYDVARRGAFAQLVDICAWLQANAGPQENVWMNAGAQRRIAYFLSGRPIQVKETPNVTWADWNSQWPIGTKADKRSKALRDFRRNIPAADRFLIVYCDHPLAGLSWPGWHWPLTADAQRPTWWLLYQRLPGGQWVPVDVPRADRTFVRSIPPAGL